MRTLQDNSLNKTCHTTIPGQGFKTQGTVSSLSPTQLFPSCAGAGMPHVLTRDIVPLPHVTSHCPQELQTDQSGQKLSSETTLPISYVAQKLTAPGHCGDPEVCVTSRVVTGREHV
ncbi:hypothetical protein MAR_018146 [Mya arenaria]|uniref:Uncharacterized protein n=1 Tax=Mya arenaria TaxID=6604 RepID=A0ABY7EDU9_MYAAR|nr:hypothetical protein MAR_018146 [Mya arenaria]